VSVSAALEIEGLTAGYQGVAAVRDIDLRVEAGKVLTLLGPNGAGKTTTLLSAVGAIKPIKGAISAFGTPLKNMRIEQIARLGVSLVPDNRGIFPTITVGDHLRLARRNSPAASVDAILERFPRLAGLRNQRAGLLSGGEQQMLALAKALILMPKVLLIDEMSLGLAPIIVQALLPVIRDMANEHGMAVVLVEQHVDLALRIADDAMVLNHGRVVMNGPAADMRRNREAVERAYFGRTES
jgi:branched-chain amino acid transport system ATP-binding protein